VSDLWFDLQQWFCLCSCGYFSQISLKIFIACKMTNKCYVTYSYMNLRSIIQNRYSVDPFSFIHAICSSLTTLQMDAGSSSESLLLCASSWTLFDYRLVRSMQYSICSTVSLASAYTSQRTTNRRTWQLGCDSLTPMFNSPIPKKVKWLTIICEY
jgi:hypothetical protein